MTPDLFERHPFEFVGHMDDGSTFTITLGFCGPACPEHHVEVRFTTPAEGPQATSEPTVEHAVAEIMEAAAIWLRSGPFARRNAVAFLEYAGAWLRSYMAEHAPGGNRVH